MRLTTSSVVSSLPPLRCHASVHYQLSLDYVRFSAIHINTLPPVTEPLLPILHCCVSDKQQLNFSCPRFSATTCLASSKSACWLSSLQWYASFHQHSPQWGAADVEIKVPSGENTELKRSLFKAWGRSVYSHTRYAYCQGFLPCLFLTFRSIHLHFV